MALLAGKTFPYEPSIAAICAQHRQSRIRRLLSVEVGPQRRRALAADRKGGDDSVRWAAARVRQKTPPDVAYVTRAANSRPRKRRDRQDPSTAQPSLMGE